MPRKKTRKRKPNTPTGKCISRRNTPNKRAICRRLAKYSCLKKNGGMKKSKKCIAMEKMYRYNK